MGGKIAGLIIERHFIEGFASFGADFLDLGEKAMLGEFFIGQCFFHKIGSLNNNLSIFGFERSSERTRSNLSQSFGGHDYSFWLVYATDYRELNGSVKRFFAFIFMHYLFDWCLIL